VTKAELNSNSQTPKFLPAGETTMRRNSYHAVIALALIALLAEVSWAQPTPGFNNKIPESILTPDTVETKVGTLEFFDGIPDEKAAAALFANLDLNRGLQAILNGMPASNFEAGRAWSHCPWPEKGEPGHSL
jgi:hypothetical protein